MLGKGNAKLSFDQASTAASPRYFIDFIGSLAGKNVAALTVVSPVKVTVAIGTFREGQSVAGLSYQLNAVAALPLAAPAPAS